jgi:ornithine cyclodeaminase/alanine dehydrogenase-like protein (mu-crystallin family)
MPPARFLDEAAVSALLPPPPALIGLLEEVLRALGAGGAGGAAAAAKGAAWSRLHEGGGSLAGRKGLAALLEAPGGAPRLILERSAFTDARLAACAALAAKHLADPRSEVVTILGCNARGRATIAAMLAVFPKMERMLCFDPDVAAQAAFADEIMTAHDLASIIPPEPREATEGAHILVSCQPVTKTPKPVVAETWMQTGTLCLPLDLDATFMPGAIARADRRLTDDLAGWKDCVAAGHLAGWPEPQGELSAVIAGTAPGRAAGVPIIALPLVGHPALDAALAGELLSRAETSGRGTVVSA